MSANLWDAWFSLGNELSVRWLITLMHSLWQGTVVGAVVWLALRLLRDPPALARYWLNATGLLAIPLCVFLTFNLVEIPQSLLPSRPTNALVNSVVAQAEAIALNPEQLQSQTPRLAVDPLPNQRLTENASGDPIIAATPYKTGISETSEPMFAGTLLPMLANWLAAGYAMIVCGFLVRLGLALRGGQRLRGATIPLTDPALLQLVADQCRLIGMRFDPVVGFCGRVAVPTVVGVLRPMVLLPASLMTGLSPSEFAAIISHELAHIRRYDLWMNLAQRVIESLLFFHPVVWLLSRRLSAERELCCDDLVVTSGNEPMNYANALLRMAELCVSVNKPQLATLAAAGHSPAELERRIERLINFDRHSKLRLTRAGVIIVLAILAAGAATPAMVWALAQSDPLTQSQANADDPSATVVPDESNDDEPGELLDANRLLADLQAHDHAFDNRSIEMEQRYVQEIYPNALNDASRWNAVRFGIKDPGPSPRVPDIKQPHRIRHLLSVRGDEIVIENLGDLEPIIDPQWVMNYRGAKSVYPKDSVHRWVPEHPDLPNLPSLPGGANGFRDPKCFRLMWSCGFGFSRHIQSIDSAIKTGETSLVKGTLNWGNSAFGPGKFELHIDQDRIVRKAIVGFHIRRYEVETFGKFETSSGLQLAERAVFKRFYSMPEQPGITEFKEFVEEEFEFTTRHVSEPLTDARFAQLCQVGKGTSVTVSPSGFTTQFVPTKFTPAVPVNIRYPHCIVETDDLPERSLIDAIAQFNQTSRESPIGLRQPPITEQETREAIKKLVGAPQVAESVRTQLNEVLKSGKLPPNVYFRRFTRFDNEHQMRGVWWVRLCVESEAPPLTSVSIRATDQYSRPYTQLERRQNAEPGVTLINRFSSYFGDVPSNLVQAEFPDDKEARFIDRARASITDKDFAAFESLFDWQGVSDSVRAFVKTEFQSLSGSTIHSIRISSRNFRGELFHWSAYQYYQPNLPVIGYLDIEYTPAGDQVAVKKKLSLEMGDAVDDFRLVNYIEIGKRNLPKGKVEGLSMRGHIEQLADGTFLVTSLITNPGTLISAHLANEEIWQRDYNKTRQSAAKTAVPADDARIEWSDPQRGIQVGLSTADDRVKFAIGEPVPFDLHIRNISDNEVEVTLPGGFRENRPRLTDSSGRSISMFQKISSFEHQSETRTIAAGKHWTIRHPVIFLGDPADEATPQQWSLYWTDPKAGKYSLGLNLSIAVKPTNKAQASQTIKSTAGSARFEVVE